jgi:hypothetical protein
VIIFAGVGLKSCFDEPSDQSSASTVSTQVAPEAKEDDSTYSDTAVQAAAMQAVKAKLSDPGSVRFRGVFVRQQASGTKAVCGEVNAKNKMGGYGGFQRFISAGTGEFTWLQEEVPDFADAWNALCVKS